MMRMLPIDWPPLFADAKVPRLVVWRDVLLTIGAWLLLYWLVWRGIMLISDDFTGASGNPLRGSEADWTVWWARLRFYAVSVGLLAIWLVIWGIVSRRRIRRYHSLPNVVPLSLAEEAAGAGCSEVELRSWRELKSVMVHFDSSDHAIIRPSHSK